MYSALNHPHCNPQGNQFLYIPPFISPIWTIRASATAAYKRIKETLSSLKLSYNPSNIKSLNSHTKHTKFCASNLKRVSHHADLFVAAAHLGWWRWELVACICIYLYLYTHRCRSWQKSWGRRRGSRSPAPSWPGSPPPQPRPPCWPPWAVLCDAMLPCSAAPSLSPSPYLSYSINLAHKPQNNQVERDRERENQSRTQTTKQPSRRAREKELRLLPKVCGHAPLVRGILYGIFYFMLDHPCKMNDIHHEYYSFYIGDLVRWVMSGFVNWSSCLF